MMSGKAFSRAVRGHLLSAAAVMSLLLQQFWDELSVEEQSELIAIYKSVNPSVSDENDVSIKLMKWIEDKTLYLSTKSRTAALWLNYTKYISLLQQFIRAERTSDWLKHISATKQMLNLLASTGHHNYAKSCRLYLQSVNKLKTEHPVVYQQFVAGNHTVRQTETNWSAVWTDLSIEQILMKSLKGRGGVIGKGMSENVLNVWTKTMHRCAEISDAMDELILNPESNDKHKELLPGRIKRDDIDFSKIQAWFIEHNPFTCGDKLVCLDSGLVDENNLVSCDRAEEKGASIHQSLTGNTYASCSIKRNTKMINLQSLYSSVVIDKDVITIDPLTLFLRLAVVFDRKPKTKVSSYFEWELTPEPTALFKGGMMRPATTKSKLKAFFLKGIPKSEAVRPHIIADGGALLWCCAWSKNQPFRKIFDKFLHLCIQLRINCVVFDGYESSTKDMTHVKRGVKMAQSVEITDNNLCPADNKEFLANYTNKQNLIVALATKMEEVNIDVVLCPSDADTTIVKKALEVRDKPVTIFSDDTDVLCLLLHHEDIANNPKPIFLKNMTCRKENESRQSYKIQDIVNQADPIHTKYSLFEHGFTGSDTTSTIYNFGKVQILQKLKKSSKLRELADKFYLDDITSDDIGKATVRFFELMHSPTSNLQEIRKQKYDSMVAGNRAKIDPALLPPSPRAAFFHGLRVYHQIRVWRKLSDTDLEPLSWGWKLENGLHTPIKTDIAAGPPDLLKIIRCGCKGPCGKSCTCRKAGLECAASCKECHGITCTNVPVIEPEPEDDG